jgi:hypothetical protein
MALLVDTEGRFVHVLPSVEYCHSPCADTAAFVVIAMPASVLADDPPVMPSSASLNLPPNRLLTVSPGGVLPVPPGTSSLAAVRVTAVASVRTGASFTAVTLTVMVRVVTRLALTPSK